MLGKLLKHEIEDQYRIYAGLYLLLFMIGLISLVANQLYHHGFTNIIIVGFRSLSTFLLIAGIMIIFIGTLIMCVLRYRNNLLKDQGYLMHTLPVTESSLYFAKLLGSIILFVLDAVVAYVVYAISVLDFGWMKTVMDTLRVEMTASLSASGGTSQVSTQIITIFLVYIVVAMVVSLCQFYVSLTLGHMSSRNRDVMSFVFFAATYLISQFCTLVALGIAIIVMLGKIPSVNQLNSMSLSATLFSTIFLAATIILTILGVAYSAISIWTLNQRLNLE